MRLELGWFLGGEAQVQQGEPDGGHHPLALVLGDFAPGRMRTVSSGDALGQRLMIKMEKLGKQFGLYFRDGHEALTSL